MAKSDDIELTIVRQLTRYRETTLQPYARVPVAAMLLERAARMQSAFLHADVLEVNFVPGLTHAFIPSWL